MSIYHRLFLGAGGGVDSAAQMVEQARNTASVLIGLGGTGIDAIRTIKKQLYTNVKPDDLDSAVPRYSHIRFVGVDSDSWHYIQQEDDASDSQTRMHLDENEFFFIGNPHLGAIFHNPNVLEMREELSWLNWEELPCPMLPEGSGAVRQIGRFLMMDKSCSFMEHIERVIREAIQGLHDPQINIHIFTGMSGGTGSGCFLDVCYMVRYVLDRIGNGVVSGYFYLPEVNLSVIPPSYVRVRHQILMNGYAAMQELDYCMQLPGNGGTFIQKYQGGVEIRWDHPPVDMCYLLGAANTPGAVAENAYEHVMDVTAQAVIAFLTTDVGFWYPGWVAQARNVLWQVEQQNHFDANIRYHTLGAARASIPYRKLNTYFASELFGRFSCVETQLPTKKDVEDFAVAVLAPGAQSVVDIYSYLRNQLYEGIERSYVSYTGVYGDVRDGGNRQLISEYQDQTMAKLNIAENNTRRMILEKNPESLIARIEFRLRELIRDISYGPMFVYGLVSAARNHNLLNIIYGLIQENTSRWDQEAAQTAIRREDYDRAKDDFDNRRRRSLFDTDAKRFAEYEYHLMQLQQHRLDMECFRMLDQVLQTLRTQIETHASMYYSRLASTMTNLLDTFRENQNYLQCSGSILDKKVPSDYPVVTLDDLKESLDTDLSKINIPVAFDGFMRRMLQSEESWLEYDENRIAHEVCGFIVHAMSGSYLNHSLTSLLQEKMGLLGLPLQHAVYQNLVIPVTELARPLFNFDQRIWTEVMSCKTAVLSVPSASAPIQAAANHMHMINPAWSVNTSMVQDRIGAITMLSGFPMCSAASIQNMRNSDVHYRGLYSYEGKPNHGMVFNDWSKLPPLKNEASDA